MQYARNPAVLWRSTSAGSVVLTPDGRDPEVLRGPLAVVWELLDRPLDAGGLDAAVAEVVEAASPTAGAVQHLVEAGWVLASP